MWLPSLLKDYLTSTILVVENNLHIWLLALIPIVIIRQYYYKQIHFLLKAFIQQSKSRSRRNESNSDTSASIISSIENEQQEEREKEEILEPQEKEKEDMATSKAMLELECKELDEQNAELAIGELSLSDFIIENGCSNNNNSIGSNNKGFDVSMAYRQIPTIPFSIASHPLACQVKKLDLTECNIRRLEHLCKFTAVECLVLDHNSLQNISSMNIPPLPTLKCLWANNNNITSLHRFIQVVSSMCSHLEELSIMRNPAVPCVEGIPSAELRQVLATIPKGLSLAQRNAKRRLKERQKQRRWIALESAGIAETKWRSLKEDHINKNYMIDVNGDGGGDNGEGDSNDDDSDGYSDVEIDVDFFIDTDTDIYADAESESLLHNNNTNTNSYSNDDNIEENGSKTDTDKATATAIPTCGDMGLEEQANGKGKKMGVVEAEVEVEVEVEEVGRVSSASTSSSASPCVCSNSYLQTQIKYRVSVLSQLPNLRVLDGVDVTAEERALSKRPGAADWLEMQRGNGEGDDDGNDSGTDDANGRNDNADLDEDDIFKWPQGYEPPRALLKNKEKRALMRTVQTELEQLRAGTELVDGKFHKIDYRAIAESTYWDVNKKTIARYCEASLWQPLFNGVPISTAIARTAEWRSTDNIPVHDLGILEKGLASGAMIVSEHLSLDGRPVVYMIFGRDRCPDAETNATCLLYTFERAIQSMSPSTSEFVLLMDMAGFGYAHVPSVAVMGRMTEMLAKHMPRRLGQVFICNVSYVVQWVYDMVSLSIAEVTRSKFRFLGSLGSSIGIGFGTDNKAEMRRAIGEVVNVAVLAREFGGDAVGVLDFDLSSYLQKDRYLQHSLSMSLSNNNNNKQQQLQPHTLTPTSTPTSTPRPRPPLYS